MPKLLALARTPSPEENILTIWREWLSHATNDNFKIIEQPSEETNHHANLIDDEYRNLEALKQQLTALHHEVMKQESKIFKLISADFHACKGLKCYIQTTMKKVPDFVHLMKTHFKHQHKNTTLTAWTCAWTNSENPVMDAKNEIEATEYLGPLPSRPADLDAIKPWHNPHDLPPSKDMDGEDVPANPFPDNFGPPYGEPEDGKSHPPFWPNGGPPFRPPFCREDGCHPPFTPPTEWIEKHGPPGAGFPPPWRPNDEPPATHPLDTQPTHRPRPHIPHPAPRHRHYRLILSVATFSVTVLILGVLFKLLRVYLSNPRVMADRAAKIEECRNRRAYRRAACQHRMKQLISRFRRRRDSTNDDYEEKRAMLRQRTSESQAGDDVMRADINSLRRAHEIVGQLMLAEEGRAQRDTSRVSTPRNVSPSNSGRSIHSVSTLPPYVAPPPRYSQELSRDMVVVDGFRYTPSNSEATVTSSASSFIIDDDATVSSVVDCRSRMSFDTESLSPSKKSLELAGDRLRRDFE